MMKHSFGKALLGLLALSAMLFSSCSAGLTSPPQTDGTPEDPTKKAAMGRYVEEALPLPKEAGVIVSLHQRQDGSLALLCSSSDFQMLGPWMLFYSKDEGETWEKQEAPWLGQFEDAAGPSVAWDQEDNLYLSFIRYSTELEQKIQKAQESGIPLAPEDYPQTECYRVTPSGEVSPIAVDWYHGDGETVSVRNLAVTESGMLVADHFDTFGVYDAESGERIDNFSVPMGQFSSFDVKDDTLLSFIGGEEAAIRQYDLKSATALDDISCGESIEQAVVSAGKDQAIYLCHPGGIFRLVEGGSVWEQVVEGELTSLNMPSMQPNTLIETPKGSFLVLCSDGTLLRYHFDETIPTTPTEEISLYALEDNKTLRQAITLFQREHPDVRVRFTVAMEPGTSVTRSDAVRALNTELLAGKGPDLMILDGLPVQSYIEKGVLLDLSEAFEGMLQSGELLTNIASAYRQDEGLYALPARFGVPLMWGDESLVSQAGSLEGLAGWAEGYLSENPDKTALGSAAPADLIRNFYVTCAPAWFDGNNALLEEPFAAFLEQMRRICGEGSDDAPAEIDFNPIWSAVEWSFGNQGAAAGVAQSWKDIAPGDAAVKQQGSGGFLLMPGQVEGVFVPQTILGINAQSDRAALAEELMKVALSEACQVNDFSDGFAVNAKAFEKGAENPYPEGDDGTSYGTMVEETGEEKWLNVLWPDAEQISAVSSRIRELQIPSTRDPVLLEMLIEETRDYFAGTQSAEEAASGAAQRIEAYLAE